MKAFNEETNWLYLYIGFLPLWCVFGHVFEARLCWGMGGRVEFLIWMKVLIYKALFFSFLFFPFPLCHCMNNLEDNEDASPFLLEIKSKALQHCLESLAFCLPLWPCLISLPEMCPICSTHGELSQPFCFSLSFTYLISIYWAQVLCHCPLKAQWLRVMRKL